MTVSMGKRYHRNPNERWQCLKPGPWTAVRVNGHVAEWGEITRVAYRLYEPGHAPPTTRSTSHAAAKRGARAARSARAPHPGNQQVTPVYRSGPAARHDRAGAARREGLRAGMSFGPVSGPGRSSAPPMMAPAAKMPAHHQNTVV